MSAATPTQDIAAAYDHCQTVTRREARNFYYAFVTLPRARRRAIYAAYAFARLADDIADGKAAPADKAAQLARLRERLRAALAGQPETPVLLALADAAHTYGIALSLFEELLDGVEMDLTPRRYATFDELREYCYRVASVVGLISIEIFGYSDPRARDAAIDLGLAMQLTNIMRDVKEDAAVGRIYLPQDEMQRYGYTEEALQAGVVDERFVALMRNQAARARDYYGRGAQLLAYLSPRSRACPAVLHGLYSKLLDRIEERGFDVYSERVRLSSPQKLRLMAKLWGTSLLPRSKHK